MKNSGTEFRVQRLCGKEFKLPLNKNGTIAWLALSKRWILAYARAYIAEFGITGQGQLCNGPNKNYGLYLKLYDEGWLRLVFSQPKYRIEILCGKTFKIPLQTKDRIDWSKISRKKLMAYARAYIKHYGIKASKQLQSGKHKNPGLQTKLYQEGLLARLFGRKKFRQIRLAGRNSKIPLNGAGRVAWERMSVRQIIAYARAYRAEYGLTGSSELSKGPHRNTGMYRQLRERGLLNEVFGRPEERAEKLNNKKYVLPLCRNGQVNWKKMNDNEVVDYAIDYRAEYKIKSRTGMKRNRALLAQLHARKLMDRVFPQKTRVIVFGDKTFNLPLSGDRICWSKIDDPTLEAYAKAHCQAKNISNVAGLAKHTKTDDGLYRTLHRRKLMHKIFDLSAEQVEMIKGQKFVLKLDSAQRVDWSNMPPETLTNYGIAYCDQHGIAYPAALQKKNASLYSALARRKLLDKVFPSGNKTVITLEGRKFRLPRRGLHFSWTNVNEDVLDIYAAAVCRAEGKDINDLPCGLRVGVRRLKVRQYIAKLPVLDQATSQELRSKYKVDSNYDLPEDLLLAFGYERFADERLRLKTIKKIVREEHQPQPGEIPMIEK